MSSIIKDSWLTKQSVYESVVKQIKDGTKLPLYYSVIEFGFYDNYGLKLPPKQIRKYWDKTEVRKTNKLLRNMLKETFDIEKLYFLIERHKPKLDKDGNEISQGRFHVNIVSSMIEDHKVNKKTMKRKVRKLLYENGKYGIAIKDMFFKNQDELKKELFNTCCKQANWINRYKYSIKTQIMTKESDIQNSLWYCLKEYRNDKEDFTDVIDFENSDFINR